MSRKRWLALIAVAILLVASLSINTATSVLFSGVDSVFGMGQQDWSEKIIEPGTDIGGTIAVLEVNGVIQDTGEGGGLFNTGGYQHRTFLSQLDYVMRDSTIKGMIIRVNTPGGGVVESAEIRNKIIQAQEEYHKPVFVSMGSMAASGGYYIAAPADQIVASPQTITGSIGVIMESINVAELAENYGVKINTIKSGPYKDIMSATREVTEEEREILQALIDESYDEFVQIIVEGRHMSEAEVRDIADGRIYSGTQAQQLNLVDELGNLDDTIAMMKERLNADYSVVQFESNVDFTSFLSMSVQQLLAPENELMGLQKLLSDHQAPTLKYLYTE